MPDLDRAPTDEKGRLPFSRERFRTLTDKFQEDHLTQAEADELLDLIKTAIWHAERTESPKTVKQLRILARGVESAKALQRQGLRP